MEEESGESSMSNVQTTSIDAAVGVTGSPTPLIDVSTGKPVKHVMYSCSDSHICSDFELVHPSVVARTPSGVDVQLAKEVVDNVSIVPFAEDDGNTQGFLLVERYPTNTLVGQKSLVVGGLGVLIVPEDGLGEYNAFAVEELACSATGEGVVVDIDIDSEVFTTFERMEDGKSSVLTVSTADRVVLRVIASLADSDEYGIAFSSGKSGSRTVIAAWTTFVG